MFCRHNDIVWIECQVHDPANQVDKNDVSVVVSIDNKFFDVKMESIKRLIPHLKMGDEVTDWQNNVWIVRCVMDDKAWCKLGEDERIFDISELSRID